MRASGVLLPIFSLPSAYGIGCFSEEAYEFVDWLKQAGQTYWQILPLGPTGFGDSPYQSYSTFAGNPYFIDPVDLVNRGYVTAADCEKACPVTTDTTVDYQMLEQGRIGLLHQAFVNSKIGKDKGFKAFCRENADWLEDYSLFMALKNYFGDAMWTDWEEDVKLRKGASLKKYKKQLADQVQFWSFVQYLFYTQWRALKEYANAQGIQIIGDIPIYVAFDSADAWANPALFQFDKDLRPISVAGCPPDAFSETGQLWGNPLYDWEYHKSTGYEWWLKRMEVCFALYDVVRIDHFRAFDEYYAIPYGDPTAQFGAWEPGPGYELFAAMKKRLGKRKVIAEDLGFLTPSVLKLVKKTGFPGMKILEFAFDSGEDNVYLPHHYQNNCVVYTGTHDNDTILGWYETLSKPTRRFLKEYLGCKKSAKADRVRKQLIRAAFASVADTCIIPMQDHLGLDGTARVNLPSTIGMNWKWRMKRGATTAKKAQELYELTRCYSRLPK